MTFLPVKLGLTVLMLIFIYFLAKNSINQLFYFFRRYFEQDKTVALILSLIFFPGTVLHELSHFFTAVILFLNVRSLSIFPVLKDNHLKLGSVQYEKRDFIRSFIVGIAPLFFGLIFFILVYLAYGLLQPNLLMNIIVAYLIFAVSSTMFSSRQDLIDLIYLPPLLIFIYGVIYVFHINLNQLFSDERLIASVSEFLNQINILLFFSLVIHLLVGAFFKFFLSRRPRRIS